MANRWQNLLIIYFFLVITSIIFLSFGFTVKAALIKYVYCRDEYMVGVLWSFIATGAMIFAFFLALFGFCVVHIRNYGVAVAFLILMVVLFILQLLDGFVAYEELKTVATRRLFNKGLMKNYSNFESVWNEVQRGILCCGVDGPNDWLNRSSQVLPLSCCEMEAGIIDACTIENAYQSGCLNNLSAYIMSFAVTIHRTIFVLASAQLVGVFLTFRIALEFRHNKATRLASPYLLITEIMKANQRLPFR